MAMLRALSSIVVLQALGAAFALATVILLTSALGADVYGRYIWIISAAGIGSLVLQRGQPTTLIKKHAPLDLAKVKAPSEMANTYLFYLLGALVTLTIAFATSLVTSNELAWIAPAAFALTALNISDAILRAAERGVRAQFARDFLRPIALFGGFILLWVAEVKEPIFYLLIFVVCTAFASIYYLCPLTLQAARNWRGAGLVKTNGAHFQVSLSRSVGNHLPIFVSGFFLTPDTLAYLAIAIRLAGPLNFGVKAARAVFGARINRHVKANKPSAIRHDYRIAILFSLFISVLAAVGVAILLLVLGYFGLGPVADLADQDLLLWVFVTIAFAQLCRAAAGPGQLTAVLLHAERFVRNYNILMLLCLSAGLIVAGLIGDVRLSAIVILFYSAGTSIGLVCKIRSALHGLRNSSGPDQRGQQLD